MSGTDDATPTSTEEAPAAPSWVEPLLDRILRKASGGEPGIDGSRLSTWANTYLDEIGTSQTDRRTALEHARRMLLRTLSEAGVAPDLRAGIESDLLDLEREIVERS